MRDKGRVFTKTGVNVLHYRITGDPNLSIKDIVFRIPTLGGFMGVVPIINFLCWSFREVQVVLYNIVERREQKTANAAGLSCKT